VSSRAVRPQPSQSSARRGRHDGERGSEAGIVIVWFAVSLMMLLGMVGFGIDLSNWWRMANRLQSASDAAALAGVVRLPGDLSLAQTEAAEIAAANGFPIAPADRDNQIKLGATPAQLKVTTSVAVRNSFLGLFGMPTTNLSRTGTAEYQGPVPMGSPENLLGNDPDQGVTKELWQNIAGQTNPKTAGDRFASGGPANNPEYALNGYYYIIRVTGATAGKDLVVHAYDPAFAMVDDLCNTNMPTAAQATALQTTYGANVAISVPANTLYSGPMYNDAATRYAPGPLSRFCTGDNTSSGTGTPISTSFTVRQPAPSGTDPVNGNPIGTATCPANVTFTPIGNEIRASITPTDPTFNTPGAQYVRQVFRRWVPICRIEAPAAGDYVLQIQTPGAKGGHNRFSLRAGLVPDTSNAAPTIAQGTGVQIFANGRLPMYVNALRPDGSTATPTFYLAEIPAGSGGRILTLEFWDIGDVSGGTTNFEVLAPNGSPVCTITPVLGGANAVGCRLNNIATGNYNGQLVTAAIQLPGNYSCSTDPLIKCWFRIRMSYSVGAQPTDTTTWVARLGGDPVRLVRNP
jgi:Flp pilus assembly protein TadG